MATSRYDILEFRAVVKPEWSELYILISPPTDFFPQAGGWYKKIIPAAEATLPALQQAMVSQDFLFWDRGAPP